MSNKKESIESGDPLFLAIQLQRRLDRLMKTTEAAERHCLKQVDLGRSENSILQALVENGKKPVNTLAEMVVLTSGSATTAVDRLVRRDFVSRSIDKKDRRVVHVKLTRAGRAIARRAQKCFNQYLEVAFSELGERERKQLLKLLEKVDIGIDKVLDESNA